MTDQPPRLYPLAPPCDGDSPAMFSIKAILNHAAFIHDHLASPDLAGPAAALSSLLRMETHIREARRHLREPSP